MGDENPIRTLGDYSRPSHEGYRNTIKLPEAGWCLKGTAKLRNDIMMFQQHHGESLFEAWTRFKDLLQKVPYHGIDLWLQAILEDLALYDNGSWNDPRDFAKPVKAIALPQDVPSTSNCRLIELENQVQRLMEAHLALTQPTQVNKITTPCEICSGPHDTQCCMENPEQAFVEYASSRTNEAGAKRDDQQNRHCAEGHHRPNSGTLPSDTVKNPKLGTHPVLSARFYPIVDPQCLPHPSSSINTIKAHFNDAIVKQLQPEEPEPTLEDVFKDLHLNQPVLELNIGLLEETDHDETKSYPVRIVKDVEVHIGKLKLLSDFYVLDMKKDPGTPFLVGREFFLTTANTVIDCRMAKIAVGEGITRRKPPFYDRKDFLDRHLPGEWEISRDVELNPFKDTLVFRRMVKFLGAIPINLKCNMWELENLIEKPIDWNKPPKNKDGAWHAKIRLIDPDGEEFTKTFQSIPTTRKLSEK
ncbi:hypothetical protein Tco_1159236 [Tanacetum coccineum]